MSYLTLPAGIPDFSKAVISLWFRVPAASMAAARAAYTGDEGVLLDGIIPLVVMGENGIGDIPTEVKKEQVVYSVANNFVFGSDGTPNPGFTIEYLGVCPQYGPGSSDVKVTFYHNPGLILVPTWPLPTYVEVRSTVQSGNAPPTNPTCIGVDCSGGTPYLYVNFETRKKPDVSSYSFNQTWKLTESIPGTGITRLTGTRIVTGCTFPFGLDFPYYDVVETIDLTPVTEHSTFATSEPVYSDITELTISATGAITSESLIEVTADQWHHVLVSLDLKTIATHGDASGHRQLPIAEYVDSASKLWVAFDDKNYVGEDLSGNSAGPNDIITEDAMSVAGAATRNQDNPGPVAKYTLSDPAVPSNNGPLGLPGTPVVVTNIYRVEMAELQMWTGITLDTGNVLMRRAFIDENGKPVKPKAAETLLGRPKILLHGSGNWKKGKNTGSAGMSNDGEIIESGQFQWTARIEAYKPEPSLHGPQDRVVV